MSDFEALSQKIEAAIDNHAQLRRLTENPVLCMPTFSVNRLGWTVDIHVKLQGSRKRPSEITANGDTAKEAADKLIESLDHWAQAIK